MFEHGEYVEVFCNDQWITCRVFRIIRDMIIAKRQDGFIWLGASEFAKPLR